MAAKLAMLVYFITILCLFLHATGNLLCDWEEGAGKISVYGKVHNVSATSEHFCRQDCISHTEFICAAVNYKQGVCELLPYDSKTISVSEGWKYSLRPSCAGIWRPWKYVAPDFGTDGTCSDTSNTTTTASSVEHCMTLCLWKTNCSLISITPDITQDLLCQFIHTGEYTISDTRDETCGSFLYLEKPAWLLDDSLHGTQYDVISYGSPPSNYLYALRSHQILYDGYMVGWEYYLEPLTSIYRFCDTYVSVRKSQTNNQMVTSRETLLTPIDNTTSGLRFQYASVTEVLTTQYMSIRTSSTPVTGCYSLVSHRRDNSQDPSGYEFRQSTYRLYQNTFYLNAGHNKNVGIGLRLYVAGYARLPTAPVVSLTDLSPGSVRLTWERLDIEDFPLAGYRVKCGLNTALTSGEFPCHDQLIPPEDHEVLLTGVDDMLPFYVGIHVVRNLNGAEKLEGLSPVQRLTCTARKSLSGKVELGEYGVLRPNIPRQLNVSIDHVEFPGLTDSCSESVELLYTDEMNVTKSTTFSSSSVIVQLEQGKEYNLVINLQLQINRMFTVWNSTHVTKQVPPSPTFSIAPIRSQSNVTIMIDEPDYTDENITHYTAKCNVTNSSFNSNESRTSLEVVQTLNLTLTLIGLHPQVLYVCDVTAYLSPNQYGYTASLKFWTAPTEVVPDWPADDLLSILANRVYVVPLPNITDKISEPGSHYSSLQVIAEQTSTSNYRTLTEYPISNNGSLYLLEEIPLPTNISNVTIGEENNGERMRRDVVEQLPPGWYNFYIGFLAATESHPVYLHVVPGGVGIQVLPPDSKTDGNDENNPVTAPGLIRGISAGVAGLVLAIVIGVVIFTVLKWKKTNDNQDEQATVNNESDVIEMIDSDIYAGEEQEQAPVNGSVAAQSPDGVMPVYQQIIKPKVPRDVAGDYENVSGPRYPIYSNVDSLRDSVTRELKQGDKAFKDEFSSLPMRTLSSNTANITQNKTKIRFKNILPYDKTRVKLETGQFYSSDFINASHVTDSFGNPSFIASQGPIEGTIEDMWRLVHDNQSQVIIMLTNLVESGKKKCCCYWPQDVGSSLVYGHFTVTLLEEQSFAEYILRKIEYKRSDMVGGRTITQLHYTRWFDHDIPSIPGLLSFRQKVNSVIKEGNSKAPIILHCSAGVGRTGTYIALENLILQVSGECPTTEEEGWFSVYSCVRRMRSERCCLVQTRTQYICLHLLLCEALTIDAVSIPRDDFSKIVNYAGQASLVRQHFQLLEKTIPLCEPNSEGKADTSSGNDVDVRLKQTTVPGNKFRVILMNPTDQNNNILDAVYCNSYRAKDGFIITKHPDQETCVDFWIMVNENKSSTVISINQTVRSLVDMATGCENLKLSMEDFTSEESIPDAQGISESIINCKLSDMAEMKVSGLTVDLTSDLPTTNQLLRLCHLLEDAITYNSQPITILCRDGVVHSGLLVVALNLFMRLQDEQEVNIVLEIKLARRSTPEFIPTVEQLELLYSFVEKCIAKDIGTPPESITHYHIDE